MNLIARFLYLAVLLGVFNLAHAQKQAAPADVRATVPEGVSVPKWPRIAPFSFEAGLPSLKSGSIELVHSRKPLEGFAIRVDENPFAVGTTPLLIGYLQQGSMRWLDMTKATLQNANVHTDGNTIFSQYKCTDADGGTWQVSVRFEPQQTPGTIEVQTDIRVDQDRSVAFLPIILLFPGAGSFGSSKGQALFAGLEYLGDEPSSSEADVSGPASRRQVPDNLKITFPLMVIQAGSRYAGLVWQMRPQFSAVFDSPDRLFQSGGHVMGLLFPGSDGKQRTEGNLLPRTAEMLHANETVSLRAAILGGSGDSIVPAIRHYTRLRPVPAVPVAPALPEYVTRAAGGWLDSKIREGNLVRHALATGGFPPQPAADAAVWSDWLALHIQDSAIQRRLRETATNLLSAVPPGRYDEAGVGHIRYPVESLVFGNVAEAASEARERGRALLARFDSNGGVKYHPNAQGPDFAKTHWTNEASGLASRVVVDLLDAATFSGDNELLKAGLQHLRELDRFHNDVPRGAQTWECPLHTPDILASAQMVRAYTIGYELTGGARFLEEAQYWAWTGLPFVYLVNPTEAPAGLYATIAVYGATHWKAPVWFGLPVQWCGLVYADALYRLARYDSKAPWKHIADGITISGMQQSWTADEPDFQGLLPDSFVLREQKRNGPAINPATVEACASRYYDSKPVYDFHWFRANRIAVHAPGEIRQPTESTGHIGFQIASWVNRPCYVLVTGLPRQPKLTINEQITDLAAPHQFIEPQGRLVLMLQGNESVKLQF